MARGPKKENGNSNGGSNGGFSIGTTEVGQAQSRDAPPPLGRPVAESRTQAPAGRVTGRTQQPEPLGFFSAFQEQVQPGRRAPQEKKQDKILMAFGQSLNEIRGQEPDPNYMIPTVDGQHENSEMIRNAYAISGQDLTPELQEITTELDQLAESANAVASMDPKVRTRLQGRTGAAQLRVIRERENELLRRADNLTRSVMTESARLQLQQQRASAMVSRESAATNAAKLQQQDADQVLSQFELADLVAMRANGTLYADLGVAPGNAIDYMARKSAEEATTQEFINSRANSTTIGGINVSDDSLIESIQGRLDLDILQAAMHNQVEGSEQPRTNDFGQLVVKLPHFGDVPYSVVKQAAVAQSEEEAGYKSLSEQAAQQENLINRTMMARQSADLTGDRYHTIFQSMGIGEQLIGSNYNFQDYLKASSTLNQKLRAASGMGNYEESSAAIELAMEEFQTKNKQIEERILSGVPEDIRPAMEEVVQSGAIYSRGNAEAVLADSSTGGRWKQDLATNPAFREAGDLLSVIMTNQTILSEGDPAGEEAAQISIQDFLNSDDNDDLSKIDKNVRVQAMRRSNVQANVRQVFSDEVISLYMSQTIAHRLAAKEAQLLATPADPRLEQQIETQLLAVRSAKQAFFGRQDVNPATAEFDPAARSLYQQEPLITGEDADVLTDSQGNALTVTTLNANNLIQNINVTQSILSEAGITDLDLRDVYAGELDQVALQSTVEASRPRGLSQMAMFRLMEHDAGGMGNPDVFVQATVQQKFAMFKDEYDNIIKQSYAADLEEAVSEDGVERARSRMYNRLAYEEVRKVVPNYGQPIPLNEADEARRQEVLTRVREQVDAMPVNQLIMQGYLGFGNEFDIYGDSVSSIGE